MTSIRVLIADGHKWVRQGLREFLESSDDISVIAEAETGAQVIDLYKRYRPDVILLDLMISQEGGLFVAQAIKSIETSARIIILTACEELNDAYFTLSQHDFDGYLIKTCEVTELQDAVRTVYHGSKVFKPSESVPSIVDS